MSDLITNAFNEAGQKGVTLPVGNFYIISLPDNLPFLLAWKNVDGSIETPHSTPNFWQKHSTHFLKTNWLALSKNEQGQWNLTQLMWDQNQSHRDIIMMALEPYVSTMSDSDFNFLTHDTYGLGKTYTQKLFLTRQAAKNQAQQTQNSQPFQQMQQNNNTNIPVDATQTIPTPIMTPQQTAEAAQAAQQTQQQGIEMIANTLQNKGLSPSQATKAATDIANHSTGQDMQQNDAVLYNTYAKQIEKAGRNGFSNPQELQEIDKLQELLTKRVANQIWNATSFDDLSEQTKNDLFQAIPSLGKGKIPKLSEFGRMNRKEILNYLQLKTGKFLNFFVLFPKFIYNKNA